MKKRIYFENLDGLRLLCFLSVFFFHSFHTEFDYIKEATTYHIIKKEIFGNGNIGVNFFFVLSGFLITYLLIEEKKLNGQIDILKFWLRRILRIWPLYFFCVAFGFWGFPFFKSLFGQAPNETASLAYFLTFLSNFDLIKNGLPDASILGVLWSVAVEEQFYFIWPILLFLVPIKRYPLLFCCIIVASTLFRAFNDDPTLHEYHTLSCIGDMVIGAMGAWLIAEKEWFKIKIEQLSRTQIGLIYFLFFFAFFFRDEILYSNYYFRIFERSFIAIIILLIILEQNYSKRSFFKMSSFSFSKKGIITYGLYCFHFFGILTVTTLTKKLGLNTKLWQVIFMDTGGALILTFLIATLSYRYFEKPFLKLKDRFAYITK